MAPTFHRLPVATVERLTPDAVAIAFDVPADLRDTFRHKAGQYVTVRLVIDGVEYRRNYSLCSSAVGDERPTIGVKRVANGAVSQYLHGNLTVGATLDLYPPMGSFCIEPNPASSTSYVLYAGGSGITPVLSIMRTLIEQQPQSRVALVYANRDEQSIMFAEQIDALAAANADRVTVHHILEDNASATRSSYAGRLDQATATALLPKIVANAPAQQHYLCGPQGMMDAVVSWLRAAGVDQAAIHQELFTISKHQAETMNAEASSTADDAAERKTRTITIRLYGTESTFEVEPDETILTAAQRANLDPPFACQIGACCTCRAKLVSGKVVMDEREALSDDEIAEGYILTCQSHPTTDNVFADYDQ